MRYTRASRGSSIDRVGVVTQRDLYLLETIAGVDLSEDRVDDASRVFAEPPYGIGIRPAALIGHPFREHKMLEREAHRDAAIL